MHNLWKRNVDFAQRLAVIGSAVLYTGVDNNLFKNVGKMEKKHYLG